MGNIGLQNKSCASPLQPKHSKVLLWRRKFSASSLCLNFPSVTYTLRAVSQCLQTSLRFPCKLRVTTAIYCPPKQSQRGFWCGTICLFATSLLQRLGQSLGLCAWGVINHFRVQTGIHRVLTEGLKPVQVKYNKILSIKMRYKDNSLNERSRSLDWKQDLYVIR